MKPNRRSPDRDPGDRVRLPVDEALRRLIDASAGSRLAGARESIAVESALGRVLAEPVAARVSVPDYHAAAMDGIAVRANGIAGAGATAPIELRADRQDERRFQWIDTGNLLPAWADAVVMVEVVEPVDPTTTPRPTAVRLRAPVAPWQHVRVVGEDVVAGEPLFSAGQRLRAHDLGLLLAAGVTTVAVRPRPVVAIVPTGDELVEPGAERTPGKIVESNSRMIAAWVGEWGGTALRLAPAPDDLDAIEARVREAAGVADVVCVLAGSSGGSRDFTSRALAGLGKVFAHGIELVPGRPTILAALHASGETGFRARVAIGIPGYPVAAAMVCRELLEPLIADLGGGARADRATVRAIAAEPLETRPGVEEVVRVDVGPVGPRLVVRPLARGAGALASLSRAGGLVRLRPGGARIRAGDEIDVELLEARSLARSTVLVSGFPDPALDALAEATSERLHGPLRFAVRSTTPDSALAALGAGTASAAVLIAPSGEGRRSAAAWTSALVAAGVEVRALRLASRPSGLIVACGNPLGLRSVDDAEREHIRALPSLKRGGVHARPPGPARGTSASGASVTDVVPPLAAAAAVASGVADYAFGTAWAAAALGLDFVPLWNEEVCLLARADLPDDAAVALADAMYGDAYRTRAARLPGYDLTGCGEDLTATR